MSIADLPALNASLNGLATVLLVIGYRMVRRKEIERHKKVMISAFVASVAFFISYLVYHFTTESVTRFSGPEAVRPFYLALLISHTVLAVAVPPLCLFTLHRAWKGQWERHRRIARITLPIWLYVSVTGVLIYLTLYQIFPAGKNV